MMENTPSPRKRKREEPGTIQTSSDPVVDPGYYRNDADCVVLVGNTLFKVHRFLLARDGSTFETMFTLPTNDSGTAPQGLSADDPIVLHDDEDEFRALCWALYALPTDIVKQSSAEAADILRLLRIIAISKKYNFSSYYTWAANTVTSHCLNKASQYLQTCQPNILAYALGIAAICDLEALCTATQSVWILRLKSDGLPVVDALQAGEKHGLRNFQGLVYYHQLQVMNSAKHQPAAGSTAMLYVDPTNTLTDRHKLRLYAGYWSLSKYWESFTTRPESALPRSGTCQSHKCLGILTYWRNSVTKVASPTADHVVVDVWARLTLLQQLFDLPSPSSAKKQHHTGICTNCMVSSKNHVAQLERDLSRTIGDHFLGPAEGMSLHA